MVDLHLFVILLQLFDRLDLINQYPDRLLVAAAAPESEPSRDLAALGALPCQQLSLHCFSEAVWVEEVTTCRFYNCPVLVANLAFPVRKGHLPPLLSRGL